MSADLQSAKTVFETHLDLPLVARGKVRDMYAVGEDRLLIVTTDRLSAFDVVLPDPIPNKGKVLNQITIFWLEFFKDIIPQHLIATDIAQMGLPEQIVKEQGDVLEGRSVLVKRAKPLPIECVVRGYITGSGWKDYLKTGSVCGHKLPAGMKQCEKFPRPIFTPATKAETGHDENINFDQAVKLCGKEVAEKARELSIMLYQRGAEYAKAKGIIIADTKFEFGLLDGQLILIDEVLTPDSSRFWPADQYEAGRDQPSFDKQIVRNYLDGLDWNKQPPAPKLPAEIAQKTGSAYVTAYEKLAGCKFH